MVSLAKDGTARFGGMSRNQIKLVDLLTRYPILNITLLDAGMQKSYKSEYRADLEELIHKKVIFEIASFRGTQLARRYCLRKHKDQLTPFFEERDALSYTMVKDDDPYRYMKHKIIGRMLLYPILIRSLVSYAMGLSGGDIKLELDELIEENILTEVRSLDPKRASRIYLTELEELLSPFR